MGIGFKGDRNSKKSKGRFDEDLDDLDISFDDLEDDEEYGDTEENEEQQKAPPKRKPLQSKRSKERAKAAQTKQNNPLDKKKKIIIGIVIAIVVILLGVFIFLIMSGGSDKAQADATLQTSQPQQQPQKQEEQKKDYPTDVNPGVPDIQMGSNMKQDSKNSDPKDFIKDINGNQIPKNYEVLRIEHAIDFIDYTKKRGITGDGTELLWLDATYKGRPYTVQVPFEVFKELDSSGITVVDVEILHIKGGAKVVSYMNVRKDYKELLKKGLNNGQ